MNYQTIIAQCWSDYVSKTPSAQAIHELLQARGETIVNDHIAFRTFGHPKTNIEVLARPFLDAGYIECGQYDFETKKLQAKHYEHPDRDAPKIFISELIVEHFTEELQHTVNRIVDQVPNQYITYPSRPWIEKSQAVYQSLLKESEYAAWLYVFGFCANHFTIFVNALTSIPTLETMNTLLKEEGFELNSAGGEIKGSPMACLEQSSILADQIHISFDEGDQLIPSCYYEFARRHPARDGSLFQGFIAQSADKIFESTNTRKMPKLN
ncbi:succinyldiaminopimelate aminotransferase [Reichenbachiella sp. 5M10]|uniref:DUF1338 domain-containing protein n=1 Tax=Reichenbachiella sp. 5M10 TaxID=1889772 RepID=UPI000C157A3C|nr:DUF1338 domain-containing protein [Reichenbachiella sp. 5M10]PIB36562.1 succinyldiaminopimelate aminotransferase [Reichenbachiella sp. 5M10]